MSDGMNKVILLGNLGTEPEVRYTSGGTAVMHFRMATNESFLDRNRQLTERTEWHSVVMFGPRAEGLARVLAKGSQLLVEGTLRTSSYEKDGTKRYKTEVHAREVCFAGTSARMPDTAAPSMREPEESFVPMEIPPAPEEPAPAVEEDRAATPPPNRSYRGRRGGSSHRREQPPAESYPF